VVVARSISEENGMAEFVSLSSNLRINRSMDLTDVNGDPHDAGVFRRRAT
jgi:hypothetical protein